MKKLFHFGDSYGTVKYYGDNKHFCEDCWKTISPNDDIICFNAFEIIEFRLNIHSILYRLKLFTSTKV